MIQDTVKTIQKAVRGGNAYANVEEIIRHHRVQASPGYRAAARYCMGYLRGQGIQSELLSYPAEEGRKYLELRMFREWSCADAHLTLLGEQEERLADFRANPMSIIQRSMPADYREEPLDIVLLDRGSRAEDYAGLEIAGKLIFIGDSHSDYMDWAVRERGAVGIVTDYMPEMKPVRQRVDVYDGTGNYSFHWGQGEEKRVFGFVLPPRTGDRLRAVCREQQARYERGEASSPYPKARAYVDSALYDGAIENVVAEIPGESGEVVLASAHLCHPRCCANDNASGAAAVMEAVRALQELIGSGALPRPKRTIRLLLIPEFTGVYAYLDGLGERAEEIKAAINLDMVGGAQDNIFGPLVVMAQPDACPSFVRDLALVILDQLKRELPTLALDGAVSTFVSTDVAFSPGSDHSVFSDPTIGIPCIALTQWPDLAYHTSLDTLEQIDPAMLARSAALCGAYLYTLATLTAEDAYEVLLRAKETFLRTTARLLEREGKQAAGRISYARERFALGAADLLRFFDGPERERVERLVGRHEAFLKQQAAMDCHGLEAQAPEPEAADAAYRAVPKRLFRGPLIATHFEKGFTVEQKRRFEALRREFPGCGSLDVSALYWCDGTRSLYQVAKLVAMERGRWEPVYISAYMHFLHSIGLVAIQ